MFKPFYLTGIFLVGMIVYANAQNTKIKGKTYAVVIGISTYQNKAIPPLSYADKDAKLFADYLQSNAGGNVPLSQIKVLLNQDATIASVYNALDWLKQVCVNEDIVYFYFSGHGDVETNDLSYTLGYLLAYNTPSNNYRNNAVSIEDINNDANFLTLQKKANVILITDACRSGKLAGDFFKGKQLVGHQLRRVLNNQVRLASCSADEEAAEGSDWDGGRGVFSYYLLRGLNGFADLSDDGIIKLQELQQFLDSSFVADRFLKLQKHKQKPVMDGSPEFALSNRNPLIFAGYKKNLVAISAPEETLPSGLAAFKYTGMQPLDHFFSIVEKLPVTGYVRSELIKNATDTVLPLKILDACIHYEDLIKRQYLEAVEKCNCTNAFDYPEVLRQLRHENDYEEKFGNYDTLVLLRNQLLKNKSLLVRFNEKLVQLIHDDAQEMINAYLAGDVAELEKRQYYYSGERNYQDFVDILKMVIQIIPRDHHLNKILSVAESYLSGVIARMNMATSSKQDSLLKVAFYHLRRAIELEPYAAYIHNELGNLYLHKQRFDSAAYHFDFAADLTPTWAIPWSNKIRMNVMQKKWGKAEEAFVKADSLQPNLSYVLMNGGLIMEHKQNWLAAESYYLKSETLNNVHFFPYERLGFIYTNTGKYADADYYFSLAKTRKKDFALNDSYFDFGIELGGQPRFQNTQQYQPDDAAISYLESVAEKFSGLPLLQHYKGKKLYKAGAWEKAEQALLTAVDQYMPEEALRAKLMALIYIGTTKTVDSNLVSTVMLYNYDVLEDHYLLADLYEKNGFFEEAIERYKIICSIENRRQMVQARVEDFDPNLSSAELHSEGLAERYEKPLIMGGAIKLARLYEKLGKFPAAEKTLLDQVALNRMAGFARQEAIDTKKPAQYWCAFPFPINFYFLNINRNLEIETYNFYKRVTTAFPRDHEWKERLGMFLYNRLLMAYEQVNVEEYNAFYKAIEKYEYPWTGKGDVVPTEEKIEKTLPGTGEKITINATLYHPVTEALQYIKQSIKLSGDEHPRKEIREVLTDLYSWTGAFDTTIALLSKQVEDQPNNASLRNKLVQFLSYNADFLIAKQHLDTLYQRRQLRKHQMMELAENHLLAGDKIKASSLLAEYQPETDLDRYDLLQKKALLNLLNGKPEKALAYLSDSFPAIEIKNTTVNGEYDYSIEQENEAKKQLKISILYTTARLYALMQKDNQALTTLKAAIDSGFGYKNILDNDEVWNRCKKNTKWTKLINSANFSTEEVQAEPIYKLLLQYCIPSNSHNHRVYLTR